MVTELKTYKNRYAAALLIERFVYLTFFIGIVY
jgi:hypothetical protein